MTKASKATRKWRLDWKKRDPDGFRQYRKDECRKHYIRHKRKMNAYSIAWHKKNRTRVNRTRKIRRQVRGPEYRASEHLKVKFGITYTQKMQLLAEQGGCCLICGCTNPGLARGGKLPNWVVDHDHRYEKLTGGIKIRGILCMTCNTLLGMARDSQAVLAAAIEYLQKNK
jgi:hypothetical protein